MGRKHKKWLIALGIVLLSTNCIWAMSKKPKQSGSPAMKTNLGIAITPRNFPSHSNEDVDAAFQMAAEISGSGYAVFIYQWHELKPQLMQRMVQRSKQAGLKPILGLSPTTLDRGRKELDLPEAVRRKAGASVSFGNPVIRRAFVRTAEEMARLQPPYLCLATEINFLAMQRLDEYLNSVREVEQRIDNRTQICRPRMTERTRRRHLRRNPTPIPRRSYRLHREDDLGDTSGQ